MPVVPSVGVGVMFATSCTPHDSCAPTVAHSTASASAFSFPLLYLGVFHLVEATLRLQVRVSMLFEGNAFAKWDVMCGIVGQCCSKQNHTCEQTQCPAHK